MRRTATASRVQIVRVPKIVRVRAPLAVRGRRALSRIRGGAKRAYSAAAEQKHLIAAVGGAAAFGLLRRYSPGTVESLTVAGMPPELVAGLGCFLGAKFTGNRMLRHAATGLLSVAAFQLAQTVGGGTAGW